MTLNPSLDVYAVINAGVYAKEEVYIRVRKHSEGALKQGIIMCLFHTLAYNVWTSCMLLLCVVFCYYYEQVKMIITGPCRIQVQSILVTSSVI